MRQTLKPLAVSNCEGCYNGREWCSIHGHLGLSVPKVSGKWTHKERRITYFCRNCWHHASFAVPFDAIKGKTIDEIRQLATDIHRAQPDSTCKNPEAVLCPTN